MERKLYRKLTVQTNCRIDNSGKVYRAPRRGLRDLRIQMGEHGPHRLGVHLGLELVPIFERDSLLCRRPRADLIDESFQIRKLLPTAIAEYGRNEPRPPHTFNVDDRIGLADHVFLLGKPCIENAGMALRFKGIAIGSLRNLLWRINAE
jgi:hypothetical protein